MDGCGTQLSQGRRWPRELQVSDERGSGSACVCCSAPTRGRANWCCTVREGCVTLCHLSRTGPVPAGQSSNHRKARRHKNRLRVPGRRLLCWVATPTAVQARQGEASLPHVQRCPRLWDMAWKQQQQLLQPSQAVEDGAKGLNAHVLATRGSAPGSTGKLSSRLCS